MNNNIKYRIKDFYYKELDKNLYLFDKMEKTISLSPQDVLDNLLYKNENGECHILYEGRERNGIIIGGSSRGSMTIGLLPE